MTCDSCGRPTAEAVPEGPYPRDDYADTLAAEDEARAEERRE